MGLLVLALVRDVLQYAGLAFTQQIFDPEIGLAPCSLASRSELVKELHLNADGTGNRDQPILLLLLTSFLGNDGAVSIRDGIQCFSFGRSVS